MVVPRSSSTNASGGATTWCRRRRSRAIATLSAFLGILALTAHHLAHFRSTSDRRHHAAQPANKTVAVVLAHFNEDLSWIARHCLDDLGPGYDPAVFIVYSRRGGARPPPDLASFCGGGGRVLHREVRNAGLEAGTFLTHILRSYNQNTPREGIADITVFMHAAEPSAGNFAGRGRGGYFWHGVGLRDYVRHGPLFVPTGMRTGDREPLVSFRKGFLKDDKSQAFFALLSNEDNEAHHGNANTRRRWHRCSSRGTAGWRPFQRDSWYRSFLRPLVRKQDADADFARTAAPRTLCGYWKRHLRPLPCPRAAVFAVGPLFSVTRAQVRAHPRRAYAALMHDGLSAHRDPYQAYFLEQLWGYWFFHPRWHRASARPDAFCPRDVRPFPAWAKKNDAPPETGASDVVGGPRPRVVPGTSVAYVDDDGDDVEFRNMRMATGTAFLQKRVNGRAAGVVSALMYDAQRGELWDSNESGGALPRAHRRAIVNAVRALCAAARVKWTVELAQQQQQQQTNKQQQQQQQQRAAQSAAAPTPPDWIVLVTVTAGHSAMFENFLHWFRRLALPYPLVVVAEDPASYTRYSVDVPEAEVVRGFGGGNRSVDHTHHTAGGATPRFYGTPAFKALMTRRPAHIARLLREGHNVLYTDIDTVWLGDPVPHCSGSVAGRGEPEAAIRPPPDLRAGLEKPMHTHEQFNAGFICIRATPGGIAFAEAWAEKLRAQPNVNQPTFNALIRRRASAAIAKFRFSTLPRREFPTGDRYFNRNQRDGVVVVHANLMMKYPRRVQLLKDAGLWVGKE